MKAVQRVPSQSDRELRRCAVQSDAQLGTARDCSDLWQRLREGGVHVADSFSTDERAYLILEQRALDKPPTAPRNWDILERVLLGQSQKVVALELGVAASTIAGTSKAALRAMGINARVSGVPPLVCMLVQASLQRGSMDAIRSTDLERNGARYRVLSIAVRTSALAERLSPAEQVVALMRIDGHSLADIATCRQTSQRTVANQLSAAFRRLGISGRPALVEYFLKSGASAAAADVPSTWHLASNSPHRQLGDT